MRFFLAISDKRLSLARNRPAYLIIIKWDFRFEVPEGELSDNRINTVGFDLFKAEDGGWLWEYLFVGQVEWEFCVGIRWKLVKVMEPIVDIGGRDLNVILFS